MTEPCALHGIPNCTSCWLKGRRGTGCKCGHPWGAHYPWGDHGEMCRVPDCDCQPTPESPEHDAPTTADYIRAEAERLPNGTAAKFLAAIKPDTVTITISREAAEHMARHYNFFDAEKREVAAACRAAINLLEGTE